MNILLSTLRTVIKSYPAVVPYLKGRARWVAYGLVMQEMGWGLDYHPEYQNKTVEFFQSTLERMVTNVYESRLSGEFIDIMANLISGQLTQAYTQAWSDEGEEGGDLPSYLSTSLEDMILNQFDFVDQYYRDIVDARVDETPIDPLLARAALWAGQWDTAYKQAQELIRLENGGNLEWVKGETEHGCNTCASLDGIVMSAREWQELDVHPRGYPNNKLECQGGGPANHCDCTLEPTDKRRSPDAYSRVIDIVLK